MVLKSLPSVEMSLNFPLVLMPMKLDLCKTALKTQAVNQCPLPHSAIYFRADLLKHYKQDNKEASMQEFSWESHLFPIDLENLWYP